MMSYLAGHNSVFWLLSGALCIVLEAFAIPGVGFLFAGLAAISLGALLNLGYITEGAYLIQLTIFFLLTIGWALLLWIPLKKLRVPSQGENFSNIIGEKAHVSETPLIKGKEGYVKWSGTLMKAKLAEDAGIAIVALGEEVEIVQAKGTMLIVKPQSYKE